MKKIVRWIDNNFEESILVILLVVMSVLLFLNIILRYVFKSSIVWANEICCYAFVLTAFLGIGYCIRKHSLMSMNSIKNALPFKVRYVVECVINVILMAFFGYYSYTCTITIRKAIKMNAETEILRFPLYVLYAAVMACYIIAVLRAVQSLIYDCKTISMGEEEFEKLEAAKKAAKKAKEGDNA